MPSMRSLLQLFNCCSSTTTASASPITTHTNSQTQTHTQTHDDDKDNDMPHSSMPTTATLPPTPHQPMIHDTLTNGHGTNGFLDGHGHAHGHARSDDIDKLHKEEDSQVTTEATKTTMAATMAPSEEPGARLKAAAEDCDRRVQAFLAREPTTPLVKAVQTQVRAAMGVIDAALSGYRRVLTPFTHLLPACNTAPEELSLSYNGGKDCLVLLILLLAALPRYYAKTSSSDSSSTDTTSSYPNTLQAVYIVSPHPFPEVDAFVDVSVARYALDLARFPSPMKPALQQYLDVRPAVRAVFVGTRRTDPHGEKLMHFDMTDGDWPRFMRVHPVIDWHYAEIWGFIRELGVEYCSLYDQGYTSLGGTTDTHPNPALKREGDEGTSHRPAYELVDDDEERLGRDR